jgi:hypothetical protein
MRLLALIILLSIMALATQASGATQTSAFTNSFLVSSFSELAASRTISISVVSSPDVNYNSNGQVDSYVIQTGGGGAIISQTIYSSAQNDASLGGLGGGSAFSTKVTATNVKGSQLVMTGTSTAEVCNKQDNSKIESQTFGMGVAEPGENEYSFEVNGAQNTVTSMVPALRIVPVIINHDELFNKELIVAFEQTPLEFEQPVDILQQEVNFNYGTSDNRPTFYGYDFTSTIAVDDTMCSSTMSFSHVN